MKQLAQFSLQCTSPSSNFYQPNLQPMSTESTESTPDWPVGANLVGLLGQNGSEGWRQGSPFLLVARVWCRHQCQGRQTWGSDDGQCSVAASSDIGHCLPPPGCSTWPRPRRWNLGLLLSAKVALFPLIIAAAGGRARAGLMWAGTLGPTSPETTIMQLPSSCFDV